MNTHDPTPGAALAVSLAALSLICGCMVGPNYHAPQVQMPPAWAGMTNSAAAADTRFTDTPVDMAQWWTRFQDPKLTSLVTDALRSNLDVQLAQSLLREAREARGRDAGGLWPSLNASGSATRSGPANGPNAGQHVNSLGAGLNAAWNLDVFGGNLLFGWLLDGLFIFFVLIVLWPGQEAFQTPEAGAEPSLRITRCGRGLRVVGTADRVQILPRQRSTVAFRPALATLGRRWGIL